MDCVGKLKTYTANRETVISEVKNITAFPGRKVSIEGDNLKQEKCLREKKGEKKRVIRAQTREKMY